jgi:orfB (fragment)
MSKAGYPYDNAPMERYFNTLKNDLIYQHHYRIEKELYAAIEKFAYVHYNHVRPHTYNKYKRLTRLVMGLNNPITKFRKWCYKNA